MIPSESSPISSSAAERIIPEEVIPRSFASPSLVPPGIVAPGSATATVWPAATFGAPQTIVRGSRVAGVDGADAEPVGVGVRLAGHDPADHEAGAVGRADRDDPLDLGPGHRQAHRELIGPDLGVAVLAQP